MNDKKSGHRGDIKQGPWQFIREAERREREKRERDKCDERQTKVREGVNESHDEDAKRHCVSAKTM